MSDKLWIRRLKWAVYDLMGAVSISEIMDNRDLVASFGRLERLLAALR